MRLFICTQAVDRTDPALGFFHRWLERFAAECESVTIVCLRKGDHDLPRHVEVIALGERGRLLRTLELCTIAWGRRHDYDAVFVHMNPEYIIAAGWLWRLLRKKIALWYAHKSVDAKLRAAEKAVGVIFTPSRESFRLPSKKVRIVGHGIDTDFFSPDSSVSRGETLLSAGRLMHSKRHDLVIRAAALAKKELRIAGEGEAESQLEALARVEGASVRFLGGVTQEKLRDEFRRAALFVHASETGSMDKVVLEALATDCPVLTTSEAYPGLPVETAAATPEALAEAIQKPRPAADRPTVIRDRHSLDRLIPRILEQL